MPAPAPSSWRGMLTRWLPGLAQVVPYPRDAWRGDIVAALAVTVVMIPSVLAYAELAGLRPKRACTRRSAR